MNYFHKIIGLILVGIMAMKVMPLPAFSTEVEENYAPAETVVNSEETEYMEIVSWKTLLV